MARIVSEEDSMAQTACGTPYYLSPEICQGNPYGPMNDIWAAGVLCFELLTLKRPFEGHSLASVVMHICHSQHVFPNHPKVTLHHSTIAAELYGHHQVPQEAKDVVDSILVKNPLQRPNAHALFEMPWLQRSFTKLVETHPSLGIMPDPVAHVVRS